jgi:hypothetical protein
MMIKHLHLKGTIGMKNARVIVQLLLEHRHVPLASLAQFSPHPYNFDLGDHSGKDYDTARDESYHHTSLHHDRNSSHNQKGISHVLIGDTTSAALDWHICWLPLRSYCYQVIMCYNMWCNPHYIGGLRIMFDSNTTRTMSAPNTTPSPNVTPSYII